ncbi:MAG: sensor histidine kinase [Hydrogenophaga sp.]|nr:sensor histidine kinase [Hydrogenophaga sp.]
MSRPPASSAHTPDRTRPRLDLRWVLAALQVFTLVPVLLFALWLLYQQWTFGQNEMKRELQQSARSLAVSVQRELNASVRQLERISEGPTLQQGSLEEFHGYMQKLSSELREWDNMVLIDQGVPVLNSAVPFGAPLPPLDDIDFEQILQSGKPFITGIYTHRLTGQPGVAVVVPVKRPSGSQQQLLMARLSTPPLANLLQEPLRDVDIVSSVVDTEGLIVSRNRYFEKLFGQPATTTYQETIATAPSGFGRARTLEGHYALSAWHRLDNGWTVGVGAHSDAHDAQLAQSLGRTAGIGLVLLAASLLIALWVAQRMGRSIESAAAHARAMADEQAVPRGHADIAQIDELLQAHFEASQRLQALRQEHTSALDRLNDALRRRDDFLSMLAHELRNPLAPIFTAVAILQRSTTLSEQERKVVGIVGNQSRQLKRLVDDLLDASRLVTGRITLQPRPTRLDTLVRETADALHDVAAEKQQRLRLRLPEAPVELEADPERVSQILHNLLDNALKFGSPGGEVRLRLVADGETAQVSVEDEGIGIDPARLQDLFKPFSQIDPGMARSNGGLGLGLSTSRTLAEMHGGTLTAESAGLGKGTTLRLTLPLRKAGPTA